MDIAHSKSPSSSSTRSIAGDENVAEESTPLLSERTPLLASSDEQDHAEPPRLHHGKTAFYIWVILLMIILFLTFGNNMIQTPSQRVMEAIFCKKHYLEHDVSKIGPDGEVDEIWCKIPAVHKPMATLRGWLDSLQAIPGGYRPRLLQLSNADIHRCFDADPVWYPSRSYRQKACIVFGSVWTVLRGVCLVLRLYAQSCSPQSSSTDLLVFFHNSIPLQVVYFGALFEFMGGAAVAIAMVMTMVADSVIPQERWVKLSGIPDAVC